MSLQPPKVSLRFSCLLHVFVLSAGCSGQQSSGAPNAEAGGGGGGGAAAEDLDGGSCDVATKSLTGLSFMHVASCSALDYPDNPPVGGDHYQYWAAYQSYSFALPRGFWVHDLEHGGVVFSYNCPAGCADEVADRQALIDSLPVDTECADYEPRRVVLTPDPLLDVRWGMSSWGHNLRANCVDDERFRQFYLNHFGQGREDECSNGTAFAAPPCP